MAGTEPFQVRPGQASSRAPACSPRDAFSVEKPLADTVYAQRKDPRTGRRIRRTKEQIIVLLKDMSKKKGRFANVTDFDPQEHFNLKVDIERVGGMRKLRGEIAADPLFPRRLLERHIQTTRDYKTEFDRRTGEVVAEIQKFVYENGRIPTKTDVPKFQTYVLKRGGRFGLVRIALSDPEFRAKLLRDKGIDAMGLLDKEWHGFQPDIVVPDFRSLDPLMARYVLETGELPREMEADESVFWMLPKKGIRSDEALMICLDELVLRYFALERRLPKDGEIPEPLMAIMKSEGYLDGVRARVEGRIGEVEKRVADSYVNPFEFPEREGTQNKEHARKLYLESLRMKIRSLKRFVHFIEEEGSKAPALGTPRLEAGQDNE